MRPMDPSIIVLMARTKLAVHRPVVTHGILGPKKRTQPGLMTANDLREKIFAKQAALEGWENWSNRHPIATFGSYWIPGVGAVTAGANAINDFSKGRWLSGIGNTAMGLGNLVGLGGIARGIGMGLKGAVGGARFIGGWGKAMQGAQQASGFARQFNALPAVDAGAGIGTKAMHGLRNIWQRGISQPYHSIQNYMDAGGQQLGNMAGQQLARYGLGAEHANKLIAAGQGMQKSPWLRGANLAQFPIAGMQMGAGFSENDPAAAE